MNIFIKMTVIKRVNLIFEGKGKLKNPNNKVE